MIRDNVTFPMCTLFLYFDTRAYKTTVTLMSVNAMLWTITQYIYCLVLPGCSVCAKFVCGDNTET